MRKLLLIAGAASHPPGQHEHRAGMLLLQRCLAAVPELDVEVHGDGWVTEEGDLEGADAVVLFADGGSSHPLQDMHRVELLRPLIERGLGVGCMHFAVEIPDGAAEVATWIGGRYVDQVSCNPIWGARFEQMPDHPVCNGVRPFATSDEWYFNLQFTAGPGACDSLLTATPSRQVREGPYVHPKGPYPHILGQAGRSEVLMWAVERPDGGRGFGLTGGHFHHNWGNDDFRRIVLNAMVWIAGATVPPDGVESVVTPEMLNENLDDPSGRPM